MAEKFNPLTYQGSLSFTVDMREMRRKTREMIENARPIFRSMEKTRQEMVAELFMKGYYDKG